MNSHCPERANIKEDCPCPKTECVNHHHCCQCIAAHRKSGKLTSCMAQLVKK